MHVLKRKMPSYAGQVLRMADPARLEAALLRQRTTQSADTTSAEPQATAA
jgi:hypothetical protein